MALRMGVTVGERHYASVDDVPGCEIEHPFVFCSDCTRSCHDGRVVWVSGCRAGERRRHV